MGRTFTLRHTLQVMPEALEERIRELCAKAVAAKDSDQLSPILSELRNALHEQDQIAKTKDWLSAGRDSYAVATPSFS